MTDNREFELQDKVAERDARIEVLEAEVKEARRGCDVRDESLIKALDERDAVFKTLDYATAHAGRLMEEVQRLQSALDSYGYTFTAVTMDPPAPEASEAGEPGDGKTCGECELWGDAWPYLGTIPDEQQRYPTCQSDGRPTPGSFLCNCSDLFRPLSGSKP